MKIHLIDGTYELFRYFYAVPPSPDTSGMEAGAVRGVLGSILQLIESGATHIGVATDHVIESFRNQLYAGYKTSDGIDPKLWAQFPLLEEALQAMGVKVWAMVDFEADDALAAAAALAAPLPDVEQVLVCSPDKDLAQCVRGTRVVQFDRRRNILRDEAGVREKWGILPQSIPDWLAVVGDTADGFPGLPGWGEKAASAMFAAHPHLEDIPKDIRQWPPGIRGAQRLAGVLQSQWHDALLFRTLATLRTDISVFHTLQELHWQGPTAAFAPLCARLQAESLAERAARISR